MPELSVLIPSRCEMFLARTIQDVLEHIEADTQIIAVLDGRPAEPVQFDDPRVLLIPLDYPVGQRAATNIAAKASEARYVMKLDAHCSVAPGFDRIMIESMQPDWTMVPVMRNLWVFDWVCPKGHRRYQGNSGPCQVCGEQTEREMVWIAKNSPQSTSYCFDPEPHFQYFGAFKRRPEGRGDLTETMSLQGSCWMLTREKYFELDVCDEAFGSWGSQGIEVALKTWLSGGRVVVNHRTYYAHAFRTKGGDWGFPYPLSGHQVENAKKMARDIFFENKWPQQVRPLSWLLERFWPVPGWSEDQLFALKMKPLPLGAARNDLVPVGQVVGMLLGGVANETTPGLSGGFGRQEMSIGAMCLSGIDEPNATLASEHVISMGHETHVEGIATTGVMTEVMQNGSVITPPIVRQGHYQPSEDQSMHVDNIAHIPNIPIAIPITSASPDPTASERIIAVNLNTREDAVDVHCGQAERLREGPASSHDNPFSHQVSTSISQHTHVRKGILYYTDNCINMRLALTCRRFMQASSLPITSVTLKPTDFGRNVVLQAERGRVTMFKQILAGLEAMKDTDIVYFAEHDVLYHADHFKFTPASDRIFYYNGHYWQLRVSDGLAVHYDVSPLSGLVAYREPLLTHFRERLAMIEEKGYGNWMGYEPMTHHRVQWQNWYDFEVFLPENPNVELCHGGNLTPKRWSTRPFIRKPKFWEEADIYRIPGWPDLPQIVRKFAAPNGGDRWVVNQKSTLAAT